MDEAKRHEIRQWLVKAEHDLRFSVGKQPHPEGYHHASERFSELVEHPPSRLHLVATLVPGSNGPRSRRVYASNGSRLSKALSATL